MDEKDYIKGFNEGYSISREMPEIAEALSKASGKGDRLNGFKDGRNQLIEERMKERRPSYLKSEKAPKDKPVSSKIPSKGIEPER
jgi:hypothetical protein